MKIKRLIIIISVTVLLTTSCKRKEIEFNKEIWFFKKLPLKADIYFKLNVDTIINEKKFLKFKRFKQVKVFFNRYGVDLLKEVKNIYSGVFLFKKNKNTYILKGKFNYKNIVTKLYRTHRRFKTDKFIFFKSKNKALYNVFLFSDKTLILTFRNTLITTDKYSKVVFNSLNIFKKVDFNAGGWLILYKSKSLKEYLSRWIELEIVSRTRFYSIAYYYNPEDSTLSFYIENHLKESFYVDEVIQTFKSFYGKLKSTYPLISKYFYSFDIRNSGNFIKISFVVDLKNIKLL